MHDVHNRPGLRFYSASQVGVNHILALHGGCQGITIQDITFKDGNAARIGILQPVASTQVQGQLNTRFF